MAPRRILTLSCTDRPGIVGAVGTFLAQSGCNIVESAQFGDLDRERFFMRVVFEPLDGGHDSAAVAKGFAPVAKRFGMDWSLHDAHAKARALILVSKQDHCLNDLLYRTRIGMIVRAGIEDSVMVDSLGINVYRVFMLVFGIGAMAAGFAGIVNAPVVSIAPDVGEAILVQTFVVVVIGGVGSFPGAILGGLIAGEISSITSMFNPGYSYVMLFIAMTLVLVLRPYGLLGTAGRE